MERSASRVPFAAVSAGGGELRVDRCGHRRIIYTGVDNAVASPEGNTQAEVENGD
jgi:hypothetical protein